MAVLTASNDSAWWAKLVLQIGVPAALALFLTWFVTLRLDSKIGTIEVTSRETHDSVDRASSSMREFAVEQHDVSLKLQLLMRQICINTAKDRLQVESCR